MTTKIHSSKFMQNEQTIERAEGRKWTQLVVFQLTVLGSTVSGSLQSISGLPRAASSALHFENVLHPVQLARLKGEGWAHSTTRCFVRSIFFPFFCAKPPQSKKTRPLQCSFRYWMTPSVNSCHPIFACEFALCASTVSVAFSMRIPCCAQLARYPWFGILNSGMSVSNSLYIFIRDGGGFTPGNTEKHNPCA